MRASEMIRDFFGKSTPELRGDIIFNGDDFDVKIISNNKEVLKAYNGKLYIYGTEVTLKDINGTEKLL